MNEEITKVVVAAFIETITDFHDEAYARDPKGWAAQGITDPSLMGSYPDKRISGNFEFYWNQFGEKIIEEIQKASKDNALISFSSIADILRHLKKQWASLFKSYLQEAQLKARNQKPKVEIHENLDEFKKKMKLFGVTEVSQENVNQANSVIELIKSLGGSIEDHGTDYKISISGSIVNIGKAVVDIFDNELASIKTV